MQQASHQAQSHGSKTSRSLPPLPRSLCTSIVFFRFFPPPFIPLNTKNMAPRASTLALAVAGMAAAASAQPAPGLAPLSPQIPAGLSIPDLPANAPRTLVRAVEAARANPAAIPPYAPALIKSATTPVTLTTKEEHKVRTRREKREEGE